MKFKFIIFFALSFIMFSCLEQEKKHIKYEESINQYNFLDKDYENKYIYDFEKLLNDNDKLEFLKKVKEYEHKFGHSIIFVSIDNTGKFNNIDMDSKNLKDILKNKFKIKSMILYEVSKTQGEIAIVYDEHLIQNDTIAKNIIDNTIINEFKSNNFSSGISKGLDSIIKKFHH